MKHTFTYYLHDDYETGEREDYIARQTGLSLAKVEALETGRPFYEVKLLCTIDDETGDIELISATL